MDKEIRIGINALVFKNPISGVGKRIICLCREIIRLQTDLGLQKKEKKPRVIFFFFAPFPSPTSLQKEFSNFPDNSFNWVNTVSLSEWSWTHFQLPYQLIKHRIDIFDSQWGGGLPTFFERYYGKLMKLFFTHEYQQIKKIITLHDLIPLELDSRVVPSQTISVMNGWSAPIKKIQNFFFKRRIAANLQSADQVVVVSESTKESLIHHFKNLPPIKVSYNGVEEIYLKTPHQTHSSSKRSSSHNLPDFFKNWQKHHGVKDYIFYIGGFNPRKNLPNLLHALENLYDQNSSLPPLVMAGKENAYFKKTLKPLIDRINQAHKQSKMILSLGYLDETRLVTYYQNTRLFVYPSLLEGFGMPALEAMAVGCPTLVDEKLALVKVLREVQAINHQNKKGPQRPASVANIPSLLLADLTHSKKLAQAIQGFLAREKEEAKKKLKKNNPALINNFPPQLLWKNIARDYLDNYLQLQGC